MTRNTSKFRNGPTRYFNATSVRFGTIVLLLLSLPTGCSTYETYKPEVAAGPAKPPGYPILIFPEDELPPRPCEVIGTVSIHDTKLTFFGGSADNEMKKMIETAREKGADAVQIKSIKKPDFMDSNYRIEADLLSYRDVWEKVVVSEGEFIDYLKKNQHQLDPIEGVWDGYGPVLHRIGIMRNTSKPGREFIGFVFETQNPTWQKGYKKIDIQHGSKPGTYNFDYYLEDFSRRSTTVFLGGNTMFRLAFPVSEERTDIITYSREQ